MKFVQIMPGTYLMGSPADEVGRSDDETQHRVTLTRGFYIGQTDVTVGQFGAFVNDSGYQTQAEAIGSALQWNGRNWAIVLRGCWHNPGFGQDSDHPVVDISWNDAMAFCDWMGSKEGRHYRLPTEAQYEYCVRAGTTTTYQWGNDVDDGKGWGNFKDLPWLIQFPTEPAFPWDDGYKFTSPVGKFPPNPWNLYDMPGNVLDWCSDWYGEYPDGDVTDPQGPSTDDAPSVTNPWFRTYHGPCRDLRGASWHAQPANVRSAWRGFAPALSVESNTGFRVVLDSP
jgi:formylglycine-generating enzyme required for sulfatase activity